MPGDIQDIFLNPIRFLRGKPYNIKMQVSINEHVIPEITVILFTRGLLYVSLQCTKNRLTCENYIANCKIFQEHQLHSRRFQGYLEVADTLCNRFSSGNQLRRRMQFSAACDPGSSVLKAMIIKALVKQ